MKLLKFFPLAFLFIYAFLIFKPFFFDGKLPIPADTIVGLYHPWRDLYSRDLPFKNYLITDPVRQQYPWRELAIDSLKKWELPKWNPYSLAGTPLLANIQAAVFYPLNFLYFLLPFSLGWSWQIILQTFLGGIFMILYLRHLKLRPEAQVLGTLAWVGSGFFIAWLEWNTLVQVAIWLPLLLLSLDKKWWPVFVFALASSLFAGHLQIWIYVFALTCFYALVNRRIGKAFILALIVVLGITAVQWWPMISFFREGARSTGFNPDWLLPWQNLVQFIAPDYFGNPATLNYFGVWNYGEFVGYIGIVPLIFALFGLNKKNIFWIGVLFLSLLFPLLPPQIVQPTRQMVLVDFSLVMLAALGFNDFLENQGKIKWPLIFLFSVLICVWIAALKLNLPVSRQNLILPTVLLFFSAFLLKNNRLTVLGLLMLTIFDLSRFAIKFESFSGKESLYPETKITKFLQEKAKTDVFRITALDDRIFPPNFSVHYRLQIISGYDSIFLRRYGLTSRISVPKEIKNDPLFLNVRYLLSFDDINDKNYVLVLQEGLTKVYENKKVLPRVLFSGTAKIEKYAENEVIIKTSSSKEDRLILMDAYYPGWQAKIDGKPTDIFIAEGIFRQITVPAGDHAVVFRI